MSTYVSDNRPETMLSGSMKLACGTAAVLGAAAVANGLFMLADPGSWYFAVPGVTTSGPFNQHFIRDIGLIFLLIGTAFLIGAARPALRASMWSLCALWLSGHSLFHFWEVAVGLCSSSTIARDFPAVTLPAIIAVVIAVIAIRPATPEKLAP